ncbi:glycosyltransferase family 92 protein RCOM_0530710 [Capsicum annuum]|uniref:glycosyltransferase family 92 protein RCOM_0530710 n=1 Tax=Capsicum annuum TaxID=4072 RepID=UPI001FB0F468|nr:glycosyltransferase family 92 protein RCOM_0530710 [Capsicum annuum]
MFNIHDIPIPSLPQFVMARKVRITFLFIITSIFFFATFYHLYLRDSISDINVDYLPILSVSSKEANNNNLVIRENISSPITRLDIPALQSDLDQDPDIIPSVSILMPDWEVYVIISPDYTPLISLHDRYICVYETREVSPAIHAGELQLPIRSLFKCELPRRARRRLPFKQTTLMKSSEKLPAPAVMAAEPELLRWSFLVYDSLTTEDDVVLFVKGLNNHQGINREPNEFRCVFDSKGKKVIRTTLTSSIQEVFRCNHPDPTIFFEGGERVLVSLEVLLPVPVIVPSVAYYYSTPRKLEHNEKSEKAHLCACTMVYNVGKFLKEWVLYHSKIGVEKFVLYDNGSDDDFDKVVDELVQEGYNVKTYFWLWPKTQEAGFSHSAIYAKDSCSWMMYIDVDEFVYSPLWSNLSRPSTSLLHSFLPHPKNVQDVSVEKRQVAEISIPCYEFGPSKQSSHPITGVTQGYNCRRKVENRHKSFVYLDAVHHSLLNVIHHFILKQGYKEKKVSVHDMAVNHYKFQAWPEFKAKFRRRVSAYVVDWTKELNPGSKDRTPGLGFNPVEPRGWPLKFCEVYDNGLKDLTRRWFALKSPITRLDYSMAWQR